MPRALVSEKISFAKFCWLGAVYFDARQPQVKLCPREYAHIVAPTSPLRRAKILVRRTFD